MFLAIVESLDAKKIGFCYFNPNVTTKIFIDQTESDFWYSTILKNFTLFDIELVLICENFKATSNITRLSSLLKEKYKNIKVILQNFNTYQCEQGVQYFKESSDTQMLASDTFLNNM